MSFVMEQQEQQFMLTTFDNPYNPFQDFSKWFLYDISNGYYTCAYLARLVDSNSDELTEEEETIAMNNAIDQIIDCDFQGIYRKIKASDEVLPVKSESIEEKGA